MPLSFTNRTAIPTNPLVENMRLRAGNRRLPDRLIEATTAPIPATQT
jgi:hypothetical protein